MPTKKKTKPAVPDAPPDPREPLEPTPANLTATLKAVKAVLADIPEPVPILVEPEPEEGADGDAAASAEGAAADPESKKKQPSKSEAAKPEAAKPEAAKSEAAKSEASTSESASSDADGKPAADGDPGAAADGGDAKAGKAKKGKEPIVKLPDFDYVDALLHIAFAKGLPCGYGQEARRRIAESFVDRNEFRVTEAYEVEDLLRDLEIPDLFDRCLNVRESIAQVYNDQNGVSMTFLPEASISDRNMFFQRVPALQPHVVAFLTNMVTIEEIVFSEKSTVRAQQRLGLDPKKPGVAKFVDELRACLKPYGHVPITIGPEGKGGKPSLKHELSPACLLARLAPAPRGRKR
ncbi:MAG: hypothetical protein AB8H80_23155 [Planctomycetota bacterium]